MGRNSAYTHLSCNRGREGPSTLPCRTPEVTGQDRCLSFYQYSLASTSKEAPDIHEVAPDATMLQFDGQQLVGYIVERLAKVKLDRINLLSLV